MRQNWRCRSNVDCIMTEMHAVYAEPVTVCFLLSIANFRQDCRYRANCSHFKVALLLRVLTLAVL
jgi:hypothetical protein